MQKNHLSSSPPGSASPVRLYCRIVAPGFRPGSLRSRGRRTHTLRTAAMNGRHIWRETHNLSQTDTHKAWVTTLRTRASNVSNIGLISLCGPVLQPSSPHFQKAQDAGKGSEHQANDEKTICTGSQIFSLSLTDINRSSPPRMPLVSRNIHMQPKPQNMSATRKNLLRAAFLVALFALAASTIAFPQSRYNLTRSCNNRTKSRLI